MAQYVVFAVGADQPGIVAAVTNSLAIQGANLEDCAMTQLSGQFAMVLVIDAADGVAEEMRTAVQTATDPFQLDVQVRPITEGAASASTTHLISVYGADRPGIVRDVSGWLAAAHINIVDLETHLVSSAPATYALLAEVVVPASVNAEALNDSLTEVAAGWGVTSNLRPVESDVL